MSRPRSRQDGFTIIELMIATIIFSTILIGATTALIQISKLYYGGVTATNTQEATRSVMNDISRQIQFSNDSPTSGAVSYPVTGDPLTVHSFCLGTIRYSYVLDAEVNSTAQTSQFKNNQLLHGLWRDSSSGDCTPLNLSQPLTGGVELLGQNMRLGHLDVSCSGRLCTVSLQIIYGDNDLIARDKDGQPIGCSSSIGSQWCAASQLSTTVYQRVLTGSGG